MNLEMYIRVINIFGSILKVKSSYTHINRDLFIKS